MANDAQIMMPTISASNNYEPQTWWIRGLAWLWNHVCIPFKTGLFWYLTIYISSWSSVRFIIFDQHADIVAQHQIEFPQYYPHPGYVYVHTLQVNQTHQVQRWHDHDAEEIQEHADYSITEACKALEAKGWATESVKVIGTSIQDSSRTRSHRYFLPRYHQSTGDNRGLESQDGEIAV
jgi:hypothetical protein